MRRILLQELTIENSLLWEFFKGIDWDKTCHVSVDDRCAQNISFIGKSVCLHSIEFTSIDTSIFMCGPISACRAASHL